jgi:hypothetical protein
MQLASKRLIGPLVKGIFNDSCVAAAAIFIGLQRAGTGRFQAAGAGVLAVA